MTPKDRLFFDAKNMELKSIMKWLNVRSIDQLSECLNKRGVMKYRKDARNPNAFIGSAKNGMKLVNELNKIIYENERKINASIEIIRDAIKADKKIVIYSQWHSFLKELKNEFPSAVIVDKDTDLDEQILLVSYQKGLLEGLHSDISVIASFTSSERNGMARIEENRATSVLVFLTLEGTKEEKQIEKAIQATNPMIWSIENLKELTNDQTTKPFFKRRKPHSV